MLDLNSIQHNKKYIFLLCVIFMMGLFSCEDESVRPDETSIQEQASLSGFTPAAKTTCGISGQTIVAPSTSQTYTYTHTSIIQNPTVTWTSSSNITLSPSPSINIVAQFASGFTSGWIRASGVSGTNGIACDEEIIITTGTDPCVPELTGPNTICVGQLTTFNWSCPDDVTWSVSSNLFIINETDTQITVGGSSTGTGTITGTVGSVSLTKSVQINDIPTPSSSVSVTGPNLLKYYQSGLFSTDLTAFSGPYTVEWVVYGFNFSNAPVHFNLTHPLNANHYVQVEVLPTAPEGIYYVQCRISNDCGTYVIDKSFEVEAGPPQLFDL